jgi:ABC-2 type transport system permease protein/sodium transport system permease protein
MNHEGFDSRRSFDASNAAASSSETGVSPVPPGAARPKRHVSGRLLRLCLKELRETLRDRRTIVTLVLMPLLVYPLLSILFNRLLSSPRSNKSQFSCVIGLDVAKEDNEQFRNYMLLSEEVLRRRQALPKSEGREKSQASSVVGQQADPEPTIQWWSGTNLEKPVAAGQVDVGVVVRRPDTSRPGRTLQVQLLYRESSALSQIGLDYLQRRFGAFNEQYLVERLQVVGVNARPPIMCEVQAIRDARPAVSLTTLIPLILILMTITGAVYPAIDLTAGERERGTLESLMAAPVPRLSLLTAKYVAVVTVALLTAVANLFAMTVTLVTTGLSEAVFGPNGLPPVLIAQVFALLILFAAFFSAILLAVTSFARSFKEAQAYLIPLMLLSLAPGMISLMPGLKFDGMFSILPLVNIVLLARDLMEGQVNATLATVAVMSTAIYAVAAIALAARIFGTDAILYGSQATWSDLLLRRPESRTAPSVSGALLLLAVLFPVYFLLANGLQRLDWLSMSIRLALSGLITAALFAGFPAVSSILQRVRLRDAFRVCPAAVAGFAAAVMFGCSLWPLAHELVLLSRTLGFNTLSPEQIQGAEKVVETLRQLSPAFVLFALAVIPAVCEELFFRGYLFAALRQRFSAAGTILITAVLFGTFHVVVTSGLSIERLLPSAFLGLMLGWVCSRTGSVLPGMLLHVVHNGLLLLIMIYRDGLQKLGWGLAEQEHMPRMWLLVSAVCMLLAALLLIWGTRRRSSNSSENR